MDESKRALIKKVSSSKSERLLNGLELCSKNDLDSLAAIIKENPEVINGKGGQQKRTLLHRCARNSLLCHVQLLLENGAEQKMDIHGNLPLHYACISGNVDIVKCLLTDKTYLEMKNFEGEKPVNLAAHCGNVEVLTYLLDQGASGTEGFSGNTVLHTAAEKCHLHIIEMLVKRGYNVNRENDKGETPLHLAAGNRLGKKCVTFLLQAGASIYTMTKEGLGPVHYAAESGSSDVMKLLIEMEAPLRNMTSHRRKSELFVNPTTEHTLLRLVAMSGCYKKGTYLINKIMSTKNKYDRHNNLKSVCCAERGSYIEQELTEQETELINMSRELAENIDHPNSVFQLFLKNNAETLVALFDRCLIYNDDNNKAHCSAKIPFICLDNLSPW